MINVKRLYLMLVFILAVFFVLAIVTPAAAQAASHTAKEAALEELRAAIRAIPDYPYITEADRPAIVKAQTLKERAMANYGITEYDICVLSAKLGAAVGKLGVEIALPSTGGLTMVPMGLLSLLAGVAIILPRKRRQ